MPVVGSRVEGVVFIANDHRGRGEGTGFRESEKMANGDLLRVQAFASLSQPIFLGSWASTWLLRGFCATHGSA